MQSLVQTAEEQLRNNLETTKSLIELEERMKVLASGDSDKVTLVLSFSDLEAQLKAQEASTAQLLNQPGVATMSFRQVPAQVPTFASLITTVMFFFF